MKRTYLLNLIYAGLMVLSLVAPRLYRDPNGGLAAAATGVAIFLGVQALALGVAIYQLLYTLRRRTELPRHELWLGIAPAVLSALLFMALLGFLQYAG